MKRLIAITVLTILMFKGGWTQNTLTGTIVDGAQEPVPFANVLLISQQDSVLHSGTISNELGEYKIEVNADSVFFQVSAVGFATIVMPIDSVQSNTVIQLSNLEFDELTVYGDTPIFSNYQGNTVVNVANTLLGYSTSIQEVVAKSPGLTVGTEGIEVIGKGTALIFVDGQKTPWSAFKAIPVSQIKSMEIVKNPEAMYDADGMSVIVVELVDLGLEGIKGSVLANYTKGFYHLGYADVSISYHKKKLTLNAGANNNIGATGGQSVRTFDIKSADPDYTATNLYKEKVYLRNVPNWLIGAKYDFDKKKSASIQYNGSYAYFDLDVDNDLTRVYEANDSTNQIVSKDKAITEDYLHSISGNYHHTLDSLGSSLFVGATYNVKSSRYHDTIFETLTSGENWSLYNQTLSLGRTLNHVQGGQIDWVKKGANNSELKAGVKYTSSGSNSSVFIQTDRIVTTDDQYVYDEALSAAYVSYYKAFSKGDFRLGLRTEHTNNQATVNGQTYLDSAYISFFPNARLSLDLKKLEYIASFSSRIQRPRFSDVTPYTYYINSFSSVMGNPKLLPSMVYTLENKVILDDLACTVGVSYNKSPRVFVALTDQETSAITYQAVNMKEMLFAFTEIGYTVRKGIWTSSNVVNLSLSKYKDDVIDISQVETTPRLYLYSYNRFSVGKNMTFELIGRYENRHKNGRVEVFPFGSLDMSLSKSFEKGNWNVQIGVFDLFRTDRRIQTSWIGADQNYGNFLGDSRYLRISVSKSFGKLKQVNYDHSNVGQGELNRAY